MIGPADNRRGGRETAGESQGPGFYLRGAANHNLILEHQKSPDSLKQAGTDIGVSFTQPGWVGMPIKLFTERVTAREVMGCETGARHDECGRRLPR